MLTWWNEYETQQCKYTLTRVRRAHKLAVTEADMAHTLHAKPVSGAIDLEVARSMMNAATKKRFDEVWKLLTEPTRTGPRGECNQSRVMRSSDVAVLAECGIIGEAGEHVEGEGIIPFTVLEEKDDDAGKTSLRRRFIAWPREYNKRLERSYVAHVPLKHVSAYLDRVHDEVAVTRDLECGFFQVALPEAARRLFWFRDDTGKKWHMNVMPMGHVCTPEIMQVLMSVIAGDPVYCVPAESTLVNSDVYIDGLRSSGTVARVRVAEQEIEDRARRMGARFKSADSYFGTRYVWCGVQYDHERHMVRIGPKTERKLKAQVLEPITAGELEALASRLVYASAVQGVHLPEYYMAMKYVRRRLNHLNRGALRIWDEIRLPPAVRAMIARWLQCFTSPTWYRPPLPKEQQLRRHTLFTDASKSGWGAVLVKKTGELCVAGAQWEDSAEFEINAAEMRAVSMALEAFKDHWVRNERLLLRIDNTSAMHAVQKGHASAERLSNELNTTLKVAQKYGITIQAEYVDTRSNPADPVSRAKGVTCERAENEELNLKKKNPCRNEKIELLARTMVRAV